MSVIKSSKILSLIYYIQVVLYYFLIIFYPHFDMILINASLLFNIIYLLINIKKTIRINISQIFFFLFVLVVCVGIVNSNLYSYEHHRYLSFLILSFLISLNLMLLRDDNQLLINFFIIANWLFFISAIIQLVSPNLLNSINRIHLTSTHYFDYLRFAGRGIIVGFTQNPAIVGFAINIILFTLFIQFTLTNKYYLKIINLILFVLSYYLVFQTGKRIYLLISVIVLAYLIFRLYGDNLKSKAKAVMLFISVAIVFWLFLVYTDIGQTLLLRTLYADDISTGRFTVYGQLWDDFVDSPIFGNGTYSTKSTIHLNNGHNIYLQILRENGVLGFIPFILMLISNLIKTDKMLRLSKINSNKAALALSQSVQLLFILWGITGNPLFDNYPLVAYVVFSSISWNIYYQTDREGVL